MTRGPYRMTSPCPKCPFRSDITGYLRRDRVREIARSLVTSEFPCHETTVNTEDGERCATSDSAHCAGALILLEKLQQPSQMMRIAERLGMYDPAKLNMDAPVFDSFAEMVKAQRR